MRCALSFILRCDYLNYSEYFIATNDISLALISLRNHQNSTELHTKVNLKLFMLLSINKKYKFNKPYESNTNNLERA